MTITRLVNHAGAKDCLTDCYMAVNTRKLDVSTMVKAKTFPWLPDILRPPFGQKILDCSVVDTTSYDELLTSPTQISFFLYWRNMKLVTLLLRYLTRKLPKKHRKEQGS